MNSNLIILQGSSVFDVRVQGRQDGGLKKGKNDLTIKTKIHLEVVEFLRAGRVHGNNSPQSFGGVNLIPIKVVGKIRSPYHIMKAAGEPGVRYQVGHGRQVVQIYLMSMWIFAIIFQWPLHQLKKETKNLVEAQVLRQSK